MSNNLNAQEYKMLVKKQTKSREGNVITEYNGVKYHSKKEAAYAQKLDWLKKDGEVLEWKRQVNYKLAIQGLLITTYRLDFLVMYSSGGVEYVDVKGRTKGNAYEMFKIKKHLMKIIHNIDVVII